jgi:hypothetical protein
MRAFHGSAGEAYNRHHYTVRNEISLRITVLDPLAGVTVKVQKGRDELLEPSASNRSELIFEFPVMADLAADTPNFLGKFVHGPKGGRFIYVNAGTYAGQADSCWARRAKLSLENIGREKVDAVIKLGGVLEARFKGTGADGGPVCASFKVPPEWKLVKR